MIAVIEEACTRARLFSHKKYKFILHSISVSYMCDKEIIFLFILEI